MERLLQASAPPLLPPQTISPSTTTNIDSALSYMDIESTSYSFSSQPSYIDPMQTTSAQLGPFDPTALLGFNAFDATSIASTSALPPLNPIEAFMATTSELLPFGWSIDLPSPALMQKLVDVYFVKSHLAGGMIHEGRFRAALALPPSHVNYRALSV